MQATSKHLEHKACEHVQAVHQKIDLPRAPNVCSDVTYIQKHVIYNNSVLSVLHFDWLYVLQGIDLPFRAFQCDAIWHRKISVVAASKRHAGHAG